MRIFLTVLFLAVAVLPSDAVAQRGYDRGRYGDLVEATGRDGSAGDSFLGLVGLAVLIGIGYVVYQGVLRKPIERLEAKKAEERAAQQAASKRYRDRLDQAQRNGNARSERSFEEITSRLTGAGMEVGRFDLFKWIASNDGGRGGGEAGEMARSLRNELYIESACQQAQNIKRKFESACFDEALLTLEELFWTKHYWYGLKKEVLDEVDPAVRCALGPTFERLKQHFSDEGLRRAYPHLCNNPRTNPARRLVGKALQAQSRFDYVFFQDGKWRAVWAAFEERQRAEQQKSV